MNNTSKRHRAYLLPLALVAGVASVSLAAQAQDAADSKISDPLEGTVTDDAPPMTNGPEIKGIISARNGEQIQVMTKEGARSVVTVTPETRINGKGGFLGLGSDRLAANALLNGLPVTIKTKNSVNGLVASQINLQNKDLKTATMIQQGTAQGFAEQTAATEALRSRVADIGEYNIKGTTNVNFDTGKFALTNEAKSDLCAAATQAEGMKNAMLLVVGYTDSTGSDEVNQRLSERRATNVVNHLQQRCGWKPYRMLTPTGMAEADPLADNTTREGKAQNRRVAVNILVSKGLDGM